MEKEENIQKESLFKIRSYTSCFKKGFELYIGNFKLLFKILWLPMLFSALIQTVMIYFIQTIPQTNSISITQILPSLIFICIFGVLGLFTDSFKLGTLFSIFNEYKEKGYIPVTSFKALRKNIFHYSWRNLKAYLWMIPYWIFIIAITMLFAFAISYGFDMHNTIVKNYLTPLFLFVVIIAFYIPMIFVYMRYMMGNEGFLKSFSKSIKVALRHWGIIFALTLITFIVVIIITFLLNMPEYILLIVKKASISSIEFGDTSGLPQGFIPFSLSVIFLCSFLQIYVGLFLYFPMLFQYASIETDDKERQNLINLNAKEDYDTMASLTNKKKDEEENFIYRS